MLRLNSLRRGVLTIALLLYLVIRSSCQQFNEVVRVVWRMEIQGFTMYQITQRLKKLKMELKKLNKEVFGDFMAAERRAKEHMIRF
ncbi:Chaperone protein ClpB [Bienertia sinuspersici]